MKRIVFLIALAACEKSNDVGKLQEEAGTVVAGAKPELDEFARRANDSLKVGRQLPATTPGLQQAGEVLTEATSTIEKLRVLLSNAPAEIDRAAKTGVPDSLVGVIDRMRAALEKDSTIINADLTTVEAYLDQHAPRG